MCALSLTDVTVGREDHAVLSGLSFSVAQGEALILTGANGIGKTTLLRTLAGLQPALAGKIDSDPDALAFASHADGIKASLSVTENLEFWASVYGGELTDAVFETFELEDLRSRLAGTLSAGQKRRLGLARLGVVNRMVLLLDEPTVSLDRFSVKRFEAFMSEHMTRGGSALIATHIDLNITAQTLDLTPFIAANTVGTPTDEAFL
jgi:heme exporter protein A